MYDHLKVLSCKKFFMVHFIFYSCFLLFLGELPIHVYFRACLSSCDTDTS